MAITHRSVCIFTVFGLIALSWYAVLLARADVSFQDNNLSSLRNAIRLVPGNAAYHALLAEHMEAEGQNPDAELKTASDLSPRESRYWIRRAFRAEVEQNYDDSERYLLNAYEVDRGFDPRWALMNFYFRRGDTAKFWNSAREAFEMGYGDLDPVFRLCMMTDSDPEVTRKVLPARREVLREFLAYLMNNKYLESSVPIADELASSVGPDDAKLLIDYSDRQMGHNDASALIVWNALSQRRALRFSRLSPPEGEIVTNGDFSLPPSQQGFDWRYGPSDTIAVNPMSAEPGLSIDISGKQPDHVILLEQEIPLKPGMQYEVSYQYKLDGESGDSGLHWAIQPGFGTTVEGDNSVAASPVLASKDWSTAKITFPSGQATAARLVLEYRRTLGTIRWQGNVQIRHLASGLAQPGSARLESAR